MNNYIEVKQFGFNSDGKINSFVFEVKNSTLSLVFISTQDNWKDTDQHSDYYIFKANDSTVNANWTITNNTYSLKPNFSIYKDVSGVRTLVTNFTPTIDDLTLMTTVVTPSNNPQAVQVIVNSSCADDCTEPTFPIYTLAKLRNEALKLYNFECCEFSRLFIDAILRIKALDLSIKANNLLQACKWWKVFVGKKVVTSKGGCHCGCR